MSDNTRDAIAAALERAVREVLDEMSVPFAMADACVPDFAGRECFFATIGFAGQIRGSLMMVASEDVIRAMSSPDIREAITCEAVVRDVVGEFTNQTLGRLKNVLIPRGVVIMLAVPTTGSGKDIEFSRAGESFSEWLSFACDAGLVSVRLDADLSACPVLTVEPAPDEGPMTEGELLLF